MSRKVAFILAFIKQMQSVLLLSVAYLIGIGITAIVTRLLGYSFIATDLTKHTTWHKRTQYIISEKMY